LRSTRLPEKVLRLLAGRPVIEHVYRVAQASGAAEVFVATDDSRVADTVARFGGQSCMTSASHNSGTDRINEVAQNRGWPDDDIVVNLQGDEPLMPPALVAQVASELAASDSGIATLCAPLHSIDEWLDPNVVKVVRDAAGNALYFSRAPIPWDRDGQAQGKPRLPAALGWRHIGLYAYRVGSLRRFSTLPPSPLEQFELLEQLRAQTNGMRIHVGVAAEQPGPGIDTEADLRAAEAILSRAGI
jgi:3-deoxy-manno-octulosonate cytidylyltransferase (CMP-KDO synthetase)